MASRKLLALLVPVFYFAVACTDRDAANPTGPTTPKTLAFGKNSCSLGISDADAQTRLTGMTNLVNSVETNGTLTPGEADKLHKSLDDAAAEIADGKYCAAIARLQGFIKQVAKFEDKGTLPGESEAPGNLRESAWVIIIGPPHVTVDGPSSAEGTYDAGYAIFGPPLRAGSVSGSLEVANDGVGTTGDACSPLVGFTAGSIAIVYRGGGCTFVEKVKNAQDADAIAVIVIDNVSATDPLGLGGYDPSITIPSVGIRQADGSTIVGGLPATATLSQP